MSDKRKRAANTLWLAREAGTYPNAYVSLAGGGAVTISLFASAGEGFGLTVDRRFARLIAKRITQCLEATR